MTNEELILSLESMIAQIRAGDRGAVSLETAQDVRVCLTPGPNTTTETPSPDIRVTIVLRDFAANERLQAMRAQYREHSGKDHGCFDTDILESIGNHEQNAPRDDASFNPFFEGAARLLKKPAAKVTGHEALRFYHAFLTAFETVDSTEFERLATTLRTSDCVYASIEASRRPRPPE